MIIFAAGAEAYVEGGADGQRDTADIALPAVAGATGVAARTDAWARRDHRYGWEAVCDAAGENGAVVPSPRSGAGAGAGFSAGGSCYISCAIELSTVSPAAPLIIAEIAGAGGQWFHGWVVRVQTGGAWELTDAVGTVKATWPAPGLAPDAKYWLLFHFDEQADRLRLWAAGEDPAAPGRLAMPSDWNEGREKISYQQNHAGGFASVALGGRNYPKTNANATVRCDSIVYSAVKPLQPVVVALAALTGDGYYAGALTEWLKGGGGAASYTEIDDPLTAAPDGDTTHIRCVPGANRTDRYSASHESAAAIGVAPGDAILAVLALANRKRAPGGGAIGTAYTFLRYSGIDDGGGQPDAWVDAGNYQTAWHAYATAPDGSAWTAASFDATEWGVVYENSVLASIEWRVTWGGLYVAYQKAAPFVAQPPDAASMRPSAGFGASALPGRPARGASAARPAVAAKVEGGRRKKE